MIHDHTTEPYKQQSQNALTSVRWQVPVLGCHNLQDRINKGRVLWCACQEHHRNYNNKKPLQKAIVC